MSYHSKMNHLSFKQNCLLLLLIIQTTFVHAGDTSNWSAGLNSLLNRCSQSSTSIKGQKPPFLDALGSCLQRRALIAMDAVMDENIIPVLNGLELVRYREDNSTTVSQHDRNGTNDARDSGKTWREKVFGRVARMFKTHVLKIDIDRLSGASDSISQVARDNAGDATVEGRRRHNRRRNHMMPMLMMGILVMGSVLIPMGFQFLAVLGGKALILAKLALMLSSIQGLKKVATNGYNYGLYHSPIADGWHERSHQEPMGHYEVPYQVFPRT